MPFGIRNILIRIVAVFEQIWNFLIQQVKQVWSFVSRLFGLTETGYFLDAESTPPTSQKTNQIKPPLDAKPPQVQVNSSSNTASRATANSRSSSRSPSSDMNYFRDMARQIRKRP
jgi:hypothetical protein